VPDLMYTDIWANLPAAAVLSCLLGPRPHVNYVNGNTALGNFNGARQNVHADLTFNHGLFAFGIVTNYYLTDVSPANGSTELWIGTHRDTTFADHRNCKENSTVSAENLREFGIRPDLLEARRTAMPPIQPTVKKGSVVLRDLRLWHAGICNPAPEPRIMLAFVHTPWVS
jgi:ectoine hydroxylase-related dioxygenase (phytanoyl-CoA dioxygenase family)